LWFNCVFGLMSNMNILAVKQCIVLNRKNFNFSISIWLQSLWYTFIVSLWYNNTDFTFFLQKIFLFRLL